MTTTRLRLLPFAAAVLLCGYLAATASAAPTTPTMNIYLCAQGVSKSVAAGTDVTLGTNWYAATRGLDLEGVHASVISVTVNGVPLPNTDSGWTFAPADDGTGAWNALWRYDLGPATTTMQIDVDYTFAHPVIDRVILYPNGQPFLFSGTEFHGSCTITVS